jgi:hypothetical protein
MKEDEKERVEINFATINDGALIEAFAIGLAEVLANIADGNTAATANRKLTLEVVFKPQFDRITIATEVGSKTSLAPIEKHTSKIFLGKTDEGSLLAFDADPRQMSLWVAPKVNKPQPLEFTPAKG